MKEPIFSKKFTNIASHPVCCVFETVLNSFFQSGINFLTRPVRSNDSCTSSFSARFLSFFFGGDKKTFNFVFITTKLCHIEKLTMDRVHEGLHWAKNQ